MIHSCAVVHVFLINSSALHTYEGLHSANYYHYLMTCLDEKESHSIGL